ncbi:hypothetical protein ACI784_06355 [Geodermatophilus sp. SYSU D01186]
MQPSPHGAADPGREPAWLRRGVLVVLVAVAGYQVVLWAFSNLRGFLGLLFLAWLFSISVEPVAEDDAPPPPDESAPLPRPETA